MVSTELSSTIPVIDPVSEEQFARGHRWRHSGGRRSSRPCPPQASTQPSGTASRHRTAPRSCGRPPTSWSFAERRFAQSTRAMSARRSGSRTTPSLHRSTSFATTRAGARRSMASRPISSRPGASRAKRPICSAIRLRSRSAWPARSSRGTGRRLTRSSNSLPRSPPAAASCSSPPRRPRSRRRNLPRSSPRQACPKA